MPSLVSVSDSEPEEELPASQEVEEDEDSPEGTAQGVDHSHREGSRAQENTVASDEERAQRVSEFREMLRSIPTNSRLPNIDEWFANDTLDDPRLYSDLLPGTIDGRPIDWMQLTRKCNDLDLMNKYWQQCVKRSHKLVNDMTKHCEELEKRERRLKVQLAHAEVVIDEAHAEMRAVHYASTNEVDYIDLLIMIEDAVGRDHTHEELRGVEDRATINDRSTTNEEYAGITFPRFAFNRRWTDELQQRIKDMRVMG
ncbi:hypothetical protein QCA50_008502 [Cerrena zonata]|uniref:Uncharacterized protein n=1 Tax=Cerrena zonata TaxID=2478898 RepID=A0AAW0G6V2_9APHY